MSCAGIEIIAPKQANRITVLPHFHCCLNDYEYIFRDFHCRLLSACTVQSCLIYRKSHGCWVETLFVQDYYLSEQEK